MSGLGGQVGVLMRGRDGLVSVINEICGVGENMRGGGRQVCRKPGEEGDGEQCSGVRFDWWV